jgi:FkbM family methyltransferase
LFVLNPYPKIASVTRKNIQFNNFSHKISAVLAGCSKNSREINIGPFYSNGAFSTLKEFKVGIKVPLLTLQDILKQYALASDDPVILKMDCEGCEYQVILSADEQTLQKFDLVMIE